MVQTAGPVRRGFTLGHALRGFWTAPSPWVLSVMFAGSVAVRLAVGDWHWSDAIVPAVLLAAFPFYEWAIHVVVLHWRPRRVAGITVDSLLSRKHRLHHADPRETALVFIPWQSLVPVVPAFAAVAVFAFPTLASGLTFYVTAAAISLGYEWTHYLVHTDYKPKTRLYKAVWRNHRLHHYKNEHYWFTVTTAGTADRILGTYPDPATVPTSPTARALHGAV
jgi:Fatty acid hydroxylase superfamily